MLVTGPVESDASDRSDLIVRIKKMDPKSPEFAALADVMAEKIAALRKAEGMVPYKLFIAGLKQTGISPTLELLVTDQQGNLYLRRRQASENQSQAEQESWGDMLHIPGTVVNPTKLLQENFYELLAREVVAHSDDSEDRQLAAKLYRTGELFSVTGYPEPERHAKTLKVLVKITVDDPAQLKDGFERVDPSDLSQVIVQHRPLVTQFFSPKEGLQIFDVV